MKFIYCIQSEWVKKRRSAANGLAFVGGFFIPLIILTGRLIHHSETLMSNSTDGIWLKLFNQCWQYMSVFLLPMGIILAASLITQIEYRNNGWKQVYTSPQTVSTIFWGKYVVVLLILFQFFILFNMGIYLTGLVPSIIYSDIPYPKESFPFWEFLSGNFKFFIDCLPILALQYLLSLHIRNFFTPIGVGFALLIASFIGMSWQYGYLIPYSYGSIQFIPADNKIDSSINMQLWAFAYFIFFTLLNYILFVLKSQTKLYGLVSKYNFISKRIIMLIALVLIVITGSLFYYFNYTPSTRLKVSSTTEIERRIKMVESNLGAFTSPGIRGWSIQDRMLHYKVKGLSIAVVNNYKIEWAKGYGMADSAENRPVTINTLFIPGSLSKSVNAMGLLRLCQDKKIDLFGDINDYLTSWKFPYDHVSKNKKITLANLLSHTAGLSVHGFWGYKNGDTLPNILQILDGNKPANSEPVRSIFEPGLKMEYSGGGVMISQLMAMDVSKQSYNQFIYNNIFKTIDMTNSFYTQPPPLNKINLLATGYDTLGNEVKGKYPILMEQAAAGLWTTSTDMCKLIIEIQRSVKGESNRVLSKQFTEMMLTPYLNETSALGFFINDNMGNKYFGHDAGNVGFSGAFYGSLEEGKGIAVFINSENSDILKEIINSVIDVYDWKGFNRKEKIKTMTISDSLVRKYIGGYEAKDENGKKVEAKIYAKGKTCFYRSYKQEREMYFISATEFVNNESPSKKTFLFDKQGNVVGFKLKHMQKQVIFKKVSS